MQQPLKISKSTGFNGDYIEFSLTKNATNESDRVSEDVIEMIMTQCNHQWIRQLETEKGHDRFGDYTKKHRDLSSSVNKEKIFIVPIVTDMTVIGTGPIVTRCSLVELF